MKFNMDAEIVALAIQKGDFSKLRGKSFQMCDNKERKANMRTKKKSKYTISQRLDRLEAIVIEGFKRVNARIDKIEARLDYNGLQIEQINNRLDYNDLKKLPETSK